MTAVFRENELLEVVERKGDHDNEADFTKKQNKIMRMIGTSVPPEILHQIRDKDTGSDMWDALCDLFENKINKTVKVHNIRRLVDELWSMKLAPGGDANLHLCKMFNVRTELASLQYTVDDIDMVEMLLESLPEQAEFETLKASIRYCADTSVYTPTKVRELIRAAASRQNEFRSKRGGGKREHQKSGGLKNAGRGRGDANQQGHSSYRQPRKCYTCGSTEHLRANCPENAKKQSGADANTSEQKRKPRGNCTIRQKLSVLPDTKCIEDAGIVAGALEARSTTVAAAAEPDNHPLPVGDLDQEVGVVSEPQVAEQSSSKQWWYFDTASNAHVTGDRANYISFKEDTHGSQSIRGVTPSLASRVSGVGTVALVTEVNGIQMVVYIDDVLYVPGADSGLFSPGLACEQGFELDLDRATQSFHVLLDGQLVAIATPQDATWGFCATRATKDRVSKLDTAAVCNFTAAEGVASLTTWHRRLGHTCQQYLKTMVDKGLVRGMMLTARQQETCDACHVGKQKKQAHWKKLDRKTCKPNQVVYADLLIPSQGNGTRYEAVLVIMDGFSRFVTVHMLTGKSSDVVNDHIKEYVLWAERQAGRRENNGEGVKIKYLVQQMLTDKGGEFVNSEMEKWYASKGIEHIKVGPKSSQLNLCERTHQSLVEMTKAMMHHAGFPRSLWPEALRNAVYIKNRVYNKGTQAIPYEQMFGVKPDLHHVRTFGALAYVHVPVAPGRRKHDANAKLGFVLGYAEDVVGCKVYFPSEHTAKFVVDIRVAENVMYRDRHAASLSAEDDLESLHFERASNVFSGTDNAASATSDESMPTATATLSALREGSVVQAGATAQDKPMVSADTNSLVGGDESGSQDKNNAAKDTEAAQENDAEVSGEIGAGSAVNGSEVEGITAILPSELPKPARSDSHVASLSSSVSRAESSAPSALSAARKSGTEEPELADERGSTRSQIPLPAQIPLPQSPLPSYASWSSQRSDAESCDGSESLVGEYGSVLDGRDADIDREDDFAEGDDDITVASTVGVDHGVRHEDVLLADIGAEHEGDHHEVSANVQQPQQTGKRTHRDETPSEEERVERGADKMEPKRKRTGLREAHERRRPQYLDDYVVNALQKTARVLDKNGKQIRASDVIIPRNHRKAVRSKFAEFWLMGEMEEVAALEAKGVIKEIPSSEVPENAKTINTMWVYSIKADQQGFVIRFKARIVALGNHQRPGIDFRETFAPVARMSSFRLLLALAAELNLQVYGGDVNTAYLNAPLGIRQYLSSIEGYPCRVPGHKYVVLKALYGLRQSGREWNTELNEWLLRRGYQRSLTEPCLYYWFEDGAITYVLVYVDDILVATNSEKIKLELFAELDSEYGIKDQGLLTQYLGVEVEQSAHSITIRQSKYCREILEKFGYENAHPVGNPMEVNARLVALTEGEECDTSFAYREGIGMLMYLATCTRPDLAFTLGQLSRFVARPSAKHVGTLKRTLRYLAGTQNSGITYERRAQESQNVVLEGFCDSDWANDPDTRRSTTGFVFVLAGGAVSWMSRRQSIVALSTAEAEYVAACEATMEAVAESNILQEILPHREVQLRIGIDNQAAHVMATDPTYSRRTRHIELRWHFVREQVQKGAIDLHKVRGEVNPADTFTKPLDKKRLKGLLGLIGVGDAYES